MTKIIKIDSCKYCSSYVSGCCLELDIMVSSKNTSKNTFPEDCPLDSIEAYENRILQKHKSESITWSIEDFTDMAKEMNYVISEDRAREALEHMISHHDASIGITWNTIDYYVREYGEPNEIINKEE